jgi:hypothetical protein
LFKFITCAVPFTCYGTGRKFSCYLYQQIDDTRVLDGFLVGTIKVK